MIIVRSYRPFAVSRFARRCFRPLPPPHARRRFTPARSRRSPSAATTPLPTSRRGSPVPGTRSSRPTTKARPGASPRRRISTRSSANPTAYAPQYGGYCAWAVAQGYTASGDPQFWKIVNGKLYLNYDGSVQAKWEKDIPGFIAKADKNWPGRLELNAASIDTSPSRSRAFSATGASNAETSRTWPKTLFDFDVTTSRPDTRAAYNVFAGDWIGYGPRVRTIFTAADADPDCALVNAHAAAVHMALEVGSGLPARRAGTFGARAQGGTRRDARASRRSSRRSHDWWRGNAASTLASSLRASWRSHPADIVAAKWAQYHAFNLGERRSDAGGRESDPACAPRDTPRRGACSPSRMSKTDDDRRRRRSGPPRAALNAEDPWAHHAIAHVMERAGPRRRRCRVPERARAVGRIAASSSASTTTGTWR